MLSRLFSHHVKARCTYINLYSTSHVLRGIHQHYCSIEASKSCYITDLRCIEWTALVCNTFSWFPRSKGFFLKGVPPPENYCRPPGLGVVGWGGREALDAEVAEVNGVRLNYCRIFFLFSSLTSCYGSNMYNKYLNPRRKGRYFIKQWLGAYSSSAVTESGCLRGAGVSCPQLWDQKQQEEEPSWD